MSLPICPTDCSSNLPTYSFDECNPEINNGQIEWLYYTTVGNPLTNINSELEWDARLDNSAAGSAKIRKLRVIGEFPPVGDNEKEVSGGRVIDGVKDFLIQGDIDETNQTNHNALRETECNTGNVLMWFETRDGLLYGGNSGIEGKLKIKLNIPKPYNDIILFPWSFKWKSKFSPERTTSVITRSTGNV